MLRSSIVLFMADGAQLTEITVTSQRYPHRAADADSEQNHPH
jgi:hypothetical protein